MSYVRMSKHNEENYGPAKEDGVAGMILDCVRCKKGVVYCLRTQSSNNSLRMTLHCWQKASEPAFQTLTTLHAPGSQGRSGAQPIEKLSTSTRAPKCLHVASKPATTSGCPVFAGNVTSLQTPQPYTYLGP